MITQTMPEYGQFLLPILGEMLWVSRLSFYPDGTVVASGVYDGTKVAAVVNNRLPELARRAEKIGTGSLIYTLEKSDSIL